MQFVRYNISTFIFFHQLAERGMNVVIMSRTKETLNQVAKEIGKSLISLYLAVCRLINLLFVICKST